MKPKKTRKNIFMPKKVRIEKSEYKKVVQKLTKGARFGKRWFPHDKK